jgi:hypothetical protein
VDANGWVNAQDVCAFEDRIRAAVGLSESEEATFAALEQQFFTANLCGGPHGVP